MQAQYLDDWSGKERRQYRRELADNQRQARELIRDGWDIVIDPIEVTPEPVDLLTALDFNNWGNQLLRANLAARMKAECTYPVVVKVFDTGGQYTHPDLSKGQLPGSNYTTSPGLPDIQGHSTHVAGIIAGEMGGLAWPLVETGVLKFKPVKVLGDNGSGSFAWLAQALTSELAHDKQVIAAGGRVVSNFSLGGGTALVGSVEQAAAASVAEGVVLVAAAGNNAGPVSYPGVSDYFAAISAIQQNTQIASFSNRGPQVIATMPGVSIVSTYKNNSYASLSGTSMASPFYTAAVAVALSKWGPKLGDYREVQKYLSLVATDLGAPGRDELFGWGLNYLLAILDTDPQQGGGDPGDPPPPPPTDPGLESVVTTTFTGPFTVRYRREAENDWSILTVTGIQATITHAGNAVDAYAILEKRVSEFGLNRGIVLTNAMQYTDAAWWYGQFLEYVARNDGFRIQVQYVETSTEAGQRHTATGFDKADQGRSIPARLVPIR